MRRQHGELERAVLNVLWDHGGWLPPAEVSDRLEADLAYTTVVTVLRRLFDKDVLARQAGGRAHLYRPYLTRGEYTAAAMAELLEAASDPATALNHFVETMGEDDRRQLERLLRRPK